MKRVYNRTDFARGFDALANAEPTKKDTQSARQAVQENIDQIRAAEKRGLSQNEIANILLEQWKADGIQVANSTLRSYIQAAKKARKVPSRKRSTQATKTTKKPPPAVTKPVPTRRLASGSKRTIVDELNEEV